MAKRKNDTKYHEVLKQAAGYSYKNGSSAPEGYKVIKSVDNKDTGFHAEVLAKGNDVIVAYRGTDQPIGIDGINDFAMARKNIPEQATEAIKVYDQVKQDYPNSDVTVTGHSLGGSLSQIVSSVRGCEAVTFNAYGVKDMFENSTNIKEDNIVNYVNEMDGITMVNGENHVGEIYSVPNIAQDSKFSIFYKLNCHYLEGMGNLSERIQKTPNEIKEKATRIHPNALKAKNKISEIGNKQSSNSQCVGSYSVSGYTRSDGTKVGDYTRACGAKHNN